MAITDKYIELEAERSEPALLLNYLTTSENMLQRRLLK